MIVNKSTAKSFHLIKECSPTLLCLNGGMVYTGDLKSPARNGLVGSNPTSGTTSALVAELVDATDSKSVSERSEGSSPSQSTRKR